MGFLTRSFWPLLPLLRLKLRSTCQSHASLADPISRYIWDEAALLIKRSLPAIAEARRVFPFRKDELMSAVSGMGALAEFPTLPCSPPPPFFMMAPALERYGPNAGRPEAP